MESEGGASAAKKDSKRKRESSVSDDVEVKSPPPSPPEEDDDDGVQVQDAHMEGRIQSFFRSLLQLSGSTHKSRKYTVMANVV